jgi:hypothetical protein
MGLNINQEDLLQLKLNLINIRDSKYAAARAQRWEEAANHRDEEKKLRDHFQHLKNEITGQLKNLEASSENKEEYVLLEGLLSVLNTVEF